MKNKLGEISKIFSNVDGLFQRPFFFLLFLTLVTTILEVFSIGMAFPFLLSIAGDGGGITSDTDYGVLLDFSKKTERYQVVVSAFFVAAATLAAIFKITLLKYQTKWAFDVGHILSCKMYGKVLSQDYISYTRMNISDQATIINYNTNKIITGVVLPVLFLSSSLLMLCAAFVFLMILNPFVTCFTFFFIAVYYLVTNNLTKKTVAYASQAVNNGQKSLVRLIHESLGGIRDLIIDNSREKYIREYDQSDADLRKSSAHLIFIGGYPKYILESITLILVGVAGLWLMDPSSKGETIAILGTFALAAQKMLPMFHNIYNAMTSIKGNVDCMSDVILALELNNLRPQFGELSELRLNNSITVNNLHYRYPGSTEWILKNISFEIFKGSVTGIIGRTGSGKSTLLDILMGLLDGYDGNVLIDGVQLKNHKYEWWSSISHVPQAIFLTSGSVLENITMSSTNSDVDYELVKQCVEISELASTVSALPNGLDTLVGERGIRLSGGQRQRIGIARALYKQSDVLFLDEATSALDSETENAVLNNIRHFYPAITLIMNTHRKDTLLMCDQIIEVHSKNFEVEVRI